MSQDTLNILGKEYKPSAEQWRLIRDAQKSFDDAFNQIARRKMHEQGELDGGGDPYYNIGEEYINRLCEIMGIDRSQHGTG